MSETKTCPKCGSVLPDNAPSGICPKCLMQAGLESVPVAGSSPEMNPTTLTSGFVPPDPKDLQKQFPQLEILELLGKGGMGAVYKARQPGLDRLVAVKILPPEIGADPAFAERFAREARALARLSHQSIVSVFDFGQADGQFYFVMEYVDGANLRQLIEAGELTPEEALAVVPQICEALQFAHNEGVVHRDIKPENILLDRQGRVKIADFGLAKILGKAPADLTLTAAHQVIGTLHYIAPEQMRGSHAVDHRADIYSLGVVFYEMLTGVLPIGKFEPPSKKVHVDVRLDEVILRTLENEPARRYQKASDVKTDVETIAGSIRPRKSRDHGMGKSAPLAPGSVERLSRRDLVLRLAGIAICFIGISLVFLPWAHVWAVGATTKIDPKYISADGTFSVLSGIQAQVVFKGYHLWQGIFSGVIFFFLGGQLLATLERRHPPLWWYVTIVLGALAVMIMSGAVAILPPAGLVGGSVQLPVFGEQEREFYNRLYAKYQGTTAAELEAGLRREGAFDLDSIQSKADQGTVKLSAAPRFAPWLSAGLGMAMLVLICAALATSFWDHGAGNTTKWAIVISLLGVGAGFLPWYAWNYAPGGPLPMTVSPRKDLGALADSVGEIDRLLVDQQLFERERDVTVQRQKQRRRKWKGDRGERQPFPVS